jgi:hypothetical protein
MTNNPLWEFSMTIRHYSIFLALLALSMSFLIGCAALQTHIEGPPLYVAERNGAKVYILGIASPSGSKWFTPAIKFAVTESKDLWREDPTETGFNQALWEELGYRKHGTLFDNLSPELVGRVRRYAQIYGVKEEELARQRTWFSAIMLVRAWLAKAGKISGQTGTPEGIISELAIKSHIPIHSEMTSDDFPKLLSALPEKTQLQYLSYELDYIEGGTNGSNRCDEGWAVGQLDDCALNLELMRIRYPDLYVALNVVRNGEWVQRIEKMLNEGGIHFIDVGINHTLGPDSIQVQLERRGTHVNRVVESVYLRISRWMSDLHI